MAGGVSRGGPHAGSLDRQIRTASKVFEGRAGRRPDGVWAAPGRVNLIGEHTDYNDGFVLPIAIDRHAVVAIGRRRDRLCRVWSMQEANDAQFELDAFEPGRLRRWPAYVLGVAWALDREGVDVPGFDLVVDSSVPIASGLSSSAALECAVAVGLAELSATDLDPAALAVVAQRGEVEGVGMPCGVMDQMAALLCRRGHALFLDTRTLSFEHVPFEPSASGFALLIVDTRAPRRLVEGAYAARRADCEAAAATLGVRALRDVSLRRVDAAAERMGPRLYRRAKHVVTENHRVLEVVDRLRTGRYDEIGPLLTASHESLRDDFEVSSPELDAAADGTLAAGALGARMTGAGFGGSALALVPGYRVSAIVEATERAFERRRLAAPAIFTVTPEDGAKRMR